MSGILFFIFASCHLLRRINLVHSNLGTSVWARLIISIHKYFVVCLDSGRQIGDRGLRNSDVLMGNKNNSICNHGNHCLCGIHIHWCLCSKYYFIKINGKKLLIFQFQNGKFFPCVWWQFQKWFLLPVNSKSWTMFTTSKKKTVKLAYLDRSVALHWFQVMLCCCFKCDAIKQNESEVEKYDFWFLDIFY